MDTCVRTMLLMQPMTTIGASDVCRPTMSEIFATRPFFANAEIDADDVAPDGQGSLVIRHPPPDVLPLNVIVNRQAKIR